MMKKITFLLALLISSIGFSQTELLTNGDFENGTAPWVGNNFSVVSGEAFISATNAAGNPWDTQLVHGSLAFTNAQEYTLTFYARAFENRTITVAIQNVGPWDDQFRQDFNLTTVMTEFTATFNATSDNANAQLGFLMAGAGFSTEIYYNDISLVTASPDPTVDASLSDLTVNGATVAGFDASTLTYDIELPEGTVAVPTVVGTPTQSSPATAVTTDAGSLPGTSTVEVTAQDGSTKETYTLNFTVAQPGVSDFCDTEVTHLDIPAEVNSAMNLTIENMGANSMKITAAASDITFLDIIGQPVDLADVTESAPDTSVSGEISITVTWTTPPIGDVTFQHIQWRKTSTGGATWQINSPTTSFDGTCGPPVSSSEDATLSDLTVDGVTVDGFSANTLTYNIELPIGTTVVPTVVGTPTQSSPATAVTTAASSLPGTSTVEVTAQDGSTKETYTLNFTIAIPTAPTDAPTPPSIMEANVISIFSDAYTDVAATWNPAWGQPTVVTDEVIATNNVKKYSNFTFSGIEPTGGTIDASAPMTHVNLSYWTSDATELKIKLVDYRGDGAWGGDNIEVEIGKPVTTGLWGTISIPLSEFTDADASFILSDIGQLVLSAVGAVNPVYIDDFYFSVGSALAVENYEIEGLNAYPNPTNDRWVISTKNETINSIEIFNVLGKSVISLRPDSREATIDASNLATGMYFSIISTDVGTSTRKLIKK